MFYIFKVVLACEENFHALQYPSAFDKECIGKNVMIPLCLHVLGSWCKMSSISLVLLHGRIMINLNYFTSSMTAIALCISTLTWSNFLSTWYPFYFLVLMLCLWF